MSAVDFDRYASVIDVVLDGYERLALERVRAGWRPLLLSMLFGPLPGRPQGQLIQMFDDVDRVYRTFLPRFLVARRNLGLRPIDELPLLIVAPDLPVGKRDKPLADVVVNDGLHLHGVMLVPPRSRLSCSVEQHFREEQGLYVRDRSRLRKLDVRPIDGAVDVAVSYILKSLRRRRFGLDELLILPRALAEMRR
jgi:hypothetical protein